MRNLRRTKYADAEDREEYLAANVFCVPTEARWGHLQANAKRPETGKLIDAMEAIERFPSNEGLKGVPDLVCRAHVRSRQRGSGHILHPEHCGQRARRHLCSLNRRPCADRSHNSALLP